MFLTNNLWTISNLLVYIHFKYAYRILISEKIKKQDQKMYDWVENYSDDGYKKIIRTGMLIRRYNISPYGNIETSINIHEEELNKLK